MHQQTFTSQTFLVKLPFLSEVDNLAAGWLQGGTGRGGPGTGGSVVEFAEPIRESTKKKKK